MKKIKSCFLRKIKVKKFKVSSAAVFVWNFMGLNDKFIT